MNAEQRRAMDIETAERLRDTIAHNSAYIRERLAAGESAQALSGVMHMNAELKREFQKYKRYLES